MRGHYVQSRDGQVLSIAWLTDYTDVNDTYIGESHFTVLDKIFVSRRCRGEGHGSELLRLICSDADREKALLVLQVCPDYDSPLDESDLMAFYGRYGFALVHEYDNLTVRKPR